MLVLDFNTFNLTYAIIMKKILILGLFLVIFIMGAFALSNQQSNNNSELKSNVIIELSESDFKSIVGDYKAKEWKLVSPTPVIIDFYAPWCGPCKKLAPILENVAKKYEGKVTIYKVNTDNNKELARRFNIRSLPTLVYMSKDGKISDTQGLVPQSTIESNIESGLLK